MKLIVCLLAFAFVAAAAAEALDFGRASDSYRTNPSVEDITFTLHTRRNDRNGVQMFLGDKESITKAGFDPKLPVKVATHGHVTNALSAPVQGLKKSFLAREDCNFISIDWSAYARNLLYEQVVRDVRTVGMHISKFVKFLRNETNFDFGNLHAMGHSLGAHVVSYISNEFPKEKVGRITGFDPAGPLFENSPPSERLDPEDARFVDVIHTSTTFLGARKPMGRVDYYPNGGNNQPGCGVFDFNCQHHMSHRYFAHTVESGKNYEAVKCDSVNDAENGRCNGEKAPMGIGAVTANPGIYYAEITATPP